MKQTAMQVMISYLENEIAESERDMKLDWVMQNEDVKEKMRLCITVHKGALEKAKGLLQKEKDREEGAYNRGYHFALKHTIRL